MANEQTPDFIPAPGSGANYGPEVSRYSGHYIGEIIEWPAATPPAHCLICDGSLVSRTTYAALFAVIGTTYGEGDGATTFNLPDMRGRVAQGTPADGTTGTMVEAGLPEIEGSMQSLALLGASIDTGALAKVYTTSYNAFGSLQQTVTSGINFAASRSNSIYGNSTTVQMPAAHINFIIVAL